MIRAAGSTATKPSSPGSRKISLQGADWSAYQARSSGCRILTPEDLLVLLQNIRSVFASGDPQKYLVPDVALTAFMDHCNKRIGEAYFRTPRTTVKAFVQLLAVLEQNPGTKWQDVLGGIDIAPDNRNTADTEGEQTGANGADDDLTCLRI